MPKYEIVIRTVVEAESLVKAQEMADMEAYSSNQYYDEIYEASVV